MKVPVAVGARVFHNLVEGGDGFGSFSRHKIFLGEHEQGKIVFGVVLNVVGVNTGGVGENLGVLEGESRQGEGEQGKLPLSPGNQCHHEPHDPQKAGVDIVVCHKT